MSPRSRDGAGIPAAVEVSAAFLRAYAAGRACFADDAWSRLWTSAQPRYWRDFLLAPGRPQLWDGSPPLGRSVLQAAADDLDLDYVAGAPLNVAGALGPKGGRKVGTLPVPVVVAFDEEENVTRFEGGIAQLTHVRCPIKLGVTYVAWGRDYGSDDEMQDGQERRREEYQARISASFARIGEIANRHTLEDARIEYVVLLGVEKAQQTLEWYRLHFTAADGPARSRWKRC